MKILAFAATTSTKSINKQLVTYATSLTEGYDTEVIDLNDYAMPLFSEDKEAEIGHPQLAKDFLDKIAGSDILFISYAEHNGSYTAAYKNIFDWASRINPNVFQDKKMLLLATSPGAGGASSVLSSAITSAPFFGGKVQGSISVPNFNENFDVKQGKIVNKEINDRLLDALTRVYSNLP